MIGDPHCHTVASDGMVGPAQLVDAAVEAHLDLIAVTDHDTMDAVREARARGEAKGLVVVPGQEITTRWPAQTHILGWFLERLVRGAAYQKRDEILAQAQRDADNVRKSQELAGKEELLPFLE